MSVDCPLHTPPPISFTNLARVLVFVPSPQVVEHVSHSLQVPQTQSTAAIYVENYYWKLNWSSLNLLLKNINYNSDKTYDMGWLDCIIPHHLHCLCMAHLRELVEGWNKFFGVFLERGLQMEVCNFLSRKSKLSTQSSLHLEPEHLLKCKKNR